MAISDISGIMGLLDRLNAERPAKFSYTETAFTDNIIEGVDAFSLSQEQNVPKADKTDYDATLLARGARSQAASIPRMAWNHFLGRFSYNLAKLTQQVREFFIKEQKIWAHNAYEYDTGQKYLTGDVCYVVSAIGAVVTVQFYKRTSVTPLELTGVSPVAPGQTDWTPAEYRSNAFPLLPINAQGYRHRYSIVDLTGGGFDANTWYPVTTGQLKADIGSSEAEDADTLQVLIEAFAVGAVTGQPSACRSELSTLSRFTGWAGSSGSVVLNNSFIKVSDGTDLGVDNSPIGFSILAKGQQAVIWLRGGSKYGLWNSFGADFTVRTAAYDNGAGDGSISPSATRVFTVSYSNVWGRFKVPAATEADDAVAFSQISGIPTMPTTLTNGQDLDTLLTIGDYLARTSAVGNSLLHGPASVSLGVCKVTVRGLTEIIEQRIIVRSTGKVYVRVWGSGVVVQDWHVVEDSAIQQTAASIISAIDAAGGVGKISGVSLSGLFLADQTLKTGDLNGYVTSGAYRIGTGATSLPAGVTADKSKLLVVNWDANNVVQVLFPPTDATQWVRVQSAGVWSAWASLMTSSVISTDVTLAADSDTLVSSQKVLRANVYEKTYVIAQADSPYAPTLYPKTIILVDLAANTDVVNINVPAASGHTGKELTVFLRTDSRTTTAAGYARLMFTAGELDVYLSVVNQSITLKSDGVMWRVVSHTLNFRNVSIGNLISNVAFRVPVTGTRIRIDGTAPGGNGGNGGGSPGTTAVSAGGGGGGGGGAGAFVVGYDLHSNIAGEDWLSAGALCYGNGGTVGSADAYFRYNGSSVLQLARGANGAAGTNGGDGTSAVGGKGGDGGDSGGGMPGGNGAAAPAAGAAGGAGSAPSYYWTELGGGGGGAGGGAPTSAPGKAGGAGGTVFGANGGAGGAANASYSGSAGGGGGGGGVNGFVRSRDVSSALGITAAIPANGADGADVTSASGTSGSPGTEAAFFGWGGGGGGGASGGTSNRSGGAGGAGADGIIIAEVTAPF